MSEEHDRKTEEVIRALEEGFAEPADVDPHDDRTREMTSTSLSRMRFEWRPDDADAMDALRSMIDDRMQQLFAGAYQVMYEMFSVVREPQVNEMTGEILTDRHGWPLWVTTDSGAYEEDWTRLGIKEQEHFLFRITTQLFGWEQSAASLWGDAMFAKAVWEEATAIGYDGSSRKTVEDRIQAARLVSRNDRLFALFQSTLSRRADALVRSMQLLSQRLKDIIVT